MNEETSYTTDNFERHLEIVKKVDALLESYDEERIPSIPKNDDFFGEKISKLYKPWNLYLTQALPIEGGVLIQEKKKKNKTHVNNRKTKPKKRKQLEKNEVLKDEKEKGFGWKNLGKRKIVYDDNLKEYVYQVIEPKLSEEEKEIKEKLIELFRFQVDVDVSGMDGDGKIKELCRILDKIIEENNINVSSNSKDKIYYYILQEFVGYGKIDILMRDDGIEDISCDGTGVPIFIYHRDYESIRTNVVFEDDEEIDSFVVKLAQICGKQLSIYEPIVDGKLPDGSRLQTTLSKTVTHSSTFTIRRFRENPLTFIDLMNSNTLSIDMVAYFWMIIEYGTSILFCGGTASGKTTTLNALSLFIPPSSKIVSIEDTREINIPHENWIAGTTRAGFSTSETNKTGKDIDMFDLIKAALRQRPRVIIVGEVRGKEAYTLFQAMATGHLSYSTVHASDMQTLIQRLESPPISLPRSLLTSLDVVVFLKAVNMADGKVRRRVTSVVEIVKQDPESGRLISVTPFRWVSPLDDRFEYSGGSTILDRIRKEKGWSLEQLNQELENRKKILRWMQKQGIRSYREVGKIVAEYKKDPEAVLKRVDVL
ncbi:MAG: secretion system protein E [Thermoplasmata archaeon]|nr:MAG: secretion system protein E [Thermoplasmata archaeon]